MDNNITQELINNESDAGSTAVGRQLLTSGSQLSDSDSDSSGDAEEDKTPKPSVHPLPHLTTTAEPVTAMDTSGEEMSCTLIKAINGVEGMDLVLQNVVSSVDMGRELDLKQITKLCLNSEYNPKRLNAMIVRIRKPRTTSLMFKSGKMVVTGARSEHLARVAARKFARIVQHFYPDIHFRDFRIVNMVAYCDIQWQLELERINCTAVGRQLLTSGSQLSDSDSDSSGDAEEDKTPKPSVHPLPHLTTTAEPVAAMDTSGDEMSCTLIKAINGVEGMDLVLQNVVSSVDMGRELDLKQIAKLCLNSEYNPKRLNAIIVRIRKPRTTSLMFKSGKMVVTGARSEHLARDRRAFKRA
ncbi:unnamed protein product [Medioppia subpectinata]|uniref:Uncharacterized protein n=1 Tax=Medioppia subpectinata TaxID=1979941 RepID=A0A7R9KL63_9ACAR|nr:unnamed protein product [Medioppia subpectinata]CAG2105286.1 unnamed protein product [Medioppia subpectinata]